MANIYKQKSNYTWKNLLLNKTWIQTLLVVISNLASYQKNDKSTNTNDNAGQIKNHVITQAWPKRGPLHR